MVRFESGIAAMAGRRVTLPMGWLDYRVSATGQPVLKLDLTLPDQTRCSVSLCGRGFPTVAASLHNHTRKRPAGLITGVVTGDGEDTRFKTSITTTCVGAVGYRRLVFRGFDQRTGSKGMWVCSMPSHLVSRVPLHFRSARYAEDVCGVCLGNKMPFIACNGACARVFHPSTAPLLPRRVALSWRWQACCTDR